MRVIYVVESLPFGRGEPFFYPEIFALLELGMELKVIPRNPRGPLVHPEAHEILPLVDAEPLLSWRILRSAVRTFLRFPRRSLEAFFLLLAPNLRHLIKNLMVYPKALWLADLATSWQADHIHAHWAASTSSMAMAASHVAGVPWSLTAHRYDLVENNLLQRKAMRARFFRCISEKTRSMALERGVPPEKTLVLHLGVPLPANEAVLVREVNRETFVLLCPASLLPVKGHVYLLEALTQLPEYVQLWLAGEGPLRSTLESKVQELGLRERVRFLGYLPHDKLLDLYRSKQVDAVVLPSVDLGEGLNEGIPVALMEAMAFGYPVVATATGGIPELLREGAGLLVPEKSSEALAEAIFRLLTDEALRKELAQRGRQRVQREFAVGEVAKVLVKLWNDART